MVTGWVRVTVGSDDDRDSNQINPREGSLICRKGKVLEDAS